MTDEKFARLVRNLFEVIEAGPMPYSGRGMFGRNCLSISGTMVQCQARIAEVLSTSHDGVVDTAVGRPQVDPFHEIVGPLLKFSWDNLGHDMVVYWPDIPWVQDDEVDGSGSVQVHENSIDWGGLG